MIRHIVLNKKRIFYSIFVFVMIAYGSSLLLSKYSSDYELSDIVIKPYKAYEVSIDDKYIGVVKESEEILDLISESKTILNKELGYYPEFNYTLNVNPQNYTKEKYEELSYDTEMLKEALKDSIVVFKEKAYIMKAGDISIALRSKDDVIDVLENAQRLYVQDESAITVSLEQDEHNPIVIVPKVRVLSKELPKDRIFVSEAMLGEPMEDLHERDEEYFEAVVSDVKIDESVVIVESFVDKKEIVDPKVAVNLITKTSEKEKVYKVQKGDVPAIIAEKNDMTEEDLYALNEGLEENATRIQIGQEITVMVPEPELTVTTTEEVIYTELIEHDNDYINNSEDYVGTYTVVEEGKDGLTEVRAMVTKVNGRVVEEEIKETTVVIEPIKGTMTKGTKQLPITTATGTFEYPVLSFRLSSVFGYRWGALHKGIDLANGIGTPILASDGGRVIKADWDGGYGKSVEIDHGNGYITKYAHCSELYVEVGQDVAQYETIAAIGNTGNSTGPHLHFEIRVNGIPKNPMDYLK